MVSECLRYKAQWLVSGMPYAETSFHLILINCCLSFVTDCIYKRASGQPCMVHGSRLSLSHMSSAAGIVFRRVGALLRCFRRAMEKLNQQAVVARDAFLHAVACNLVSCGLLLLIGAAGPLSFDSPTSFT